MDQYFLPNDSKGDRLQVLRDTCEKSIPFNYPKELSKEELDNLKDQLAQDNIKMTKLEEKRKEFMDSHKAELKPLQTRAKDCVEMLRRKSEDVEEEVYLIADQEEGIMGYYNADGKLVHFRSLTQDERQTRMYSIQDVSRNGTSN